MTTEIIDKRPCYLRKTFDELEEGEMFFFVDSTILRMKTYDVTDNGTGEVITNTVDLGDGFTSYTPISEYVIPVRVTITIEQ